MIHGFSVRLLTCYMIVDSKWCNDACCSYQYIYNQGFDDFLADRSWKIIIDHYRTKCFITKIAGRERIRLDKVLRLFIFALFDTLLWVSGSDHMNKGSWSCFTGRVNVDLVGVQVLLVWQPCRKCQTCVCTVLCSMTWALASLCAIKYGPPLRWFYTTCSVELYWLQ